MKNIVDSFIENLRGQLSFILGETAEIDITPYKGCSDGILLVKTVCFRNTMPNIPAAFPAGFCREAGVRLPRYERVFNIDVNQVKSSDLTSEIYRFADFIKSNTATCTVVDVIEKPLSPKLTRWDTRKLIYIYSSTTGEWRKSKHAPFEKRTQYIES
jgi:hypothetical protein